jgi:hypothetical protein
MKKLIVLFVLAMFLSMSVNVFAVPTYGDVGPTTNFSGDVGTSGAYYINGTLIDLEDIGTAGLITEAMLKGVDAPADEEILTYEVTTGDFEWELPDELFTAGTNLTWNGDHVSLDVDDSFLLNNGDIGTGVYDFGGADTFEIPNKNADPAVTGQILLDTTVADMTNGALAYYDGAAIRYVVDLAAADIWSSDDYVVAYDADADKFYMKADANSGFTGNFVQHLMDVDAADADYVHVAIVGAGEANEDVTTGITNPDFGRNITVTSTADSVGTVTITGTTAGGVTDATDVITIVDGTIAYGVKAFVTVTKIRASDAFISPEEVTIGIGDVIGLVNAIDAEADIYSKTVDGVNEFDEISGNGDTTNETLDCATIVQNEDITIYYHN